MKNKKKEYDHFKLENFHHGYKKHQSFSTTKKTFDQNQLINNIIKLNILLTTNARCRSFSFHFKDHNYRKLCTNFFLQSKYVPIIHICSQYMGALVRMIKCLSLLEREREKKKNDTREKKENNKI